MRFEAQNDRGLSGRISFGPPFPRALPWAKGGRPFGPQRRFFGIRRSTFGFRAAFTLIELLVVISIVALMAAVAVPVVKKFTPNVTAGETRQLLDAVSRARQLAISQRTTIYMVFVPPGLGTPFNWFWNDPNYNQTKAGTWTASDLALATNLFDKQLVAYTFVSLHSLGDQPGSSTARYLAPWRTLPEGTFIPVQKFVRPRQQVLTISTNGNTAFQIYSFNWTNNIPFPSDSTAPAPSGSYIYLPYLAFNYQGQLVNPLVLDASSSPTPMNDLIPIAQGAVNFARNPVTGAGAMAQVTANELPPGNTTNSFNIVSIDGVTGRAHVEHPQVQ